MFHVELNPERLIDKGKVGLLVAFFMLTSCIGTRQSIQIPDYLLVPKGKEIIGNKGLTAFIFENNLKKMSFEQYLAFKFKADNYSQKEFWVDIDNSNFKIIVYDYAEFEKYFISANYSPINLEPDNVQNLDKRKFIALSIINSFNEDCLSEDSLYKNIAAKYLKNLKDEYNNQ
jgi:hypothetical protein